MTKIRSTTVLGIYHNGEVALGADGQATMDKHIAKSNVKKIRKLLDGKVVTGFAGSTADAFTLLERFEEKLLIISGTGDVLEPDNQIAAIGSGSMYAHAAALALKKHAPHLSAEEMVREGLNIAADICIYTNHNLIIEKPAK